MKGNIATLIFFISCWCHAQEEAYDNIRSERKLGFGIQVGGPTLVASFELDYFLTRNINIEAGIGIIGFYGGAKWYFGAKNKPSFWAPYFGVCIIALPDDILGGDWEEGGYFPLGVQYLSKRGMTLAAEIAGLYHGAAQTHIFGAFKIGLHF